MCLKQVTNQKFTERDIQILKLSLVTHMMAACLIGQKKSSELTKFAGGWAGGRGYRRTEGVWGGFITAINPNVGFGSRIMPC